MCPFTVSVVIPAFGRAEPLKFTLRSAAVAAHTLGERAEIILVDDGSQPPLADELAGFDAGHPIRILRQANTGSIGARQTGLAAALGEFVQFLDSDDLIHPEKLLRQITAMRAHSVDICYADPAKATLGAGYSVRSFQPSAPLDRTANSVELLLRIQPGPHNPIFRRDYLQKSLKTPLVPASRDMDPAGDVWLYYNLAVHPTPVCKVDAALAAIGPHSSPRYSRCWEKLGLAALLIMETFVDRCPRTAATEIARRTVGVCAFATWRSLPHGYHRSIEARTLAVWRRLPRAPLAHLGGPVFRRVATLVGPETAGHLFRLRQHRYDSCRTLPADELVRLAGPN